MSAPDTSLALHPFFLAGFGDGPYRFLYCYDLGEAMNPDSAANFGNMTGWTKDAPKLKAGLGTCACCGMAISLICIISNAAGELYGVGSDCAEKTGNDGIQRNGIKAALALRTRAKNRARAAAKRAAKFEAERPERERLQAEANAKAAEQRAENKAKKLARFDTFATVLAALVHAPTLAKWRNDYTADAFHTASANLWATFSPPCDLSSFYQSLAIQLIESGSLSTRQAEYAAKAVYGRKQSDERNALFALLTA